jgi:hypothetical protein
MAQPGNSDTLSDGETLDTIADRVHSAHDFMHGNDRDVLIGKFAVDDVKVGPADAAGANSDANLIHPETDPEVPTPEAVAMSSASSRAWSSPKRQLCEGSGSHRRRPFTHLAPETQTSASASVAKRTPERCRNGIQLPFKRLIHVNAQSHRLCSAAM